MHDALENVVAVSSDKPRGKDKSAIPLVLDDDAKKQFTDVALTRKLCDFAMYKGADPDTARDLTQQSLLLLLSGQLPWNRQEQPNLLNRLYGVLRNRLREWRALGRQEPPLTAFDRDDESGDGGVTNWVMDTAADPHGDAEALARRAEDEAWETECLDDLKKRLARHPLAIRVLERRQVAEETQAQIAEALGVTLREIEAAYERILYHAEFVREKYRSRR